MNRVHFGERLRDFLEYREMSQADFGKLVGRAQNSVSRWVEQQEWVRRPAMKRMLEALWRHGINPRYFYDASVTDWHAPPVMNVSEEEYRAMAARLESIEEKWQKVRARNTELKKRLDECLKKKNPGTD